MPSLVDRYPDLLPMLDDPALNQLVIALDRAYGPENPQVAMPAELRTTLGVALRHRVMEHPAAPLRLHRRLMTRQHAGMAVRLAAALVCSGTALVALQDRAEYPQVNPPAPVFAAMLSQAGHPIHAERQGCGYTVAITRAYAEANRVIVSLAIQGPPGRHFVALSGTGQLSLTMGGQRLRWLDATHMREMDGSLGRTADNISTLYAAFDAHQLVHGAQLLHLQVTLPSFSLVEQLRGMNFAQVSCERYSSAAFFRGTDRATLPDRLRAVGAGLLPGLFVSHVGRTVNIDGGFVIPFSVRVDPVHVWARPDQAMTPKPSP
jgi:hypothetical protein